MADEDQPRNVKELLVEAQLDHAPLAGGRLHVVTAVEDDPDRVAPETHRRVLEAAGRLN